MNLPFMSKVRLVSYITITIIVSMQQIKIMSLNSQIKSWQQEANNALREQAKCESSLNAQNALIAKYDSNETILKQRHKNELDNLTKELSQRKTEIVEVLKKDPSCENQLRIIEQDQKRFLNG